MPSGIFVLFYQFGNFWKKCHQKVSSFLFESQKQSENEYMCSPAADGLLQKILRKLPGGSLCHKLPITVFYVNNYIVFYIIPLLPI